MFVVELGFEFIDSFLLLAAGLLQLGLGFFAFGVLLKPVGEELNGEGWFLAICLCESFHQDVGDLGLEDVGDCFFSLFGTHVNIIYKLHFRL